MTARSAAAPRHGAGGAADEGRRALAEDLLTSVSALRRTWRRLSRRPEVLSTLTGAQIELVRVVRRRPGGSVAEAATELSLAPNTVSTLVRQLGDSGVIERSVSTSDRRIAVLDLRPDVRRDVDAWRDRRTDLLAVAVGRLPEGDRRCLVQAVRVLDRLAEEIGANQ